MNWNRIGSFVAEALRKLNVPWAIVIATLLLMEGLSNHARAVRCAGYLSSVSGSQLVTAYTAGQDSAGIATKALIFAECLPDPAKTSGRKQ